MPSAERYGTIRLRLGECEVAIELQAIGRARNFATGLHDSKDHTTDHAGSVPCWRVSSFISSLA